MAKTALIQRELKRDKLVAQYAKKFAELKAIATDGKKSDEELAARVKRFVVPLEENVMTSSRHSGSAPLTLVPRCRTQPRAVRAAAQGAQRKNTEFFKAGGATQGVRAAQGAGRGIRSV